MFGIKIKFGFQMVIFKMVAILFRFGMVRTVQKPNKKW